MLDQIVVPTAVRSRTPAEQVGVLTNLLRDAGSLAGIAALKDYGYLSPLLDVFLAEGTNGAAEASVKPEDSLAFEMEPNGIPAEVALAQDSALPVPRYQLCRMTIK